MAKIQNLGNFAQPNGVKIDSVEVTFTVCKEYYTYILRCLADVSSHYACGLANDESDNGSCMASLLTYLMPNDIDDYEALRREPSIFALNKNAEN